MNDYSKVKLLMVSYRTYNRLKNHGQMGSTFDQVIEDILDRIDSIEEKQQKQNQGKILLIH
jgi:hypothetical protein